MNHEEKVAIRIDGTTLEVPAGSQLAAALMDKGFVSLRTSPSGDPRGVLCAMGSCHECRATVDGHRSVRTCLVTVQDGMDVITESPLEKKPLPEVEHCDVSEDETDVVVIGSGPAGLSAACAAAERGQKVLVIDESPRPGGRIWAHRSQMPAVVRNWIDRADRAGVRRLQGATVIDGETGLLESASVVSGARTRVRCQKIIVATGARERFLPFPGWTLPGVTGAGALQSLIKGGLDVKGKRYVIAGTGPLLLAVAAIAVSAGAEVILVEQASILQRVPLAFSLLSSLERMREGWQLWKALQGVEKISSCWPVKAQGDQVLEKVHLKVGNTTRIEEVDGLAVGFGLIPETRVAQGLGCMLEKDGRVKVDRYQRTSVEGVLCAGEPTGIAGSEAALASGQIAGTVAAGATPAFHLVQKLRSHRNWGVALERTHSLRPELIRSVVEDVIVCRCEDVASSSIRGVLSLRQARMQHRIGMGPCQGRVCMPILALGDTHQHDTVRPPWSTSPSPRAELSSTDGH